MVDLVKIRKKAKEKKEKGSTTVGASPEQPAQGAGPQAPLRDESVPASQQLSNPVTQQPKEDRLAAFLASAGERHQDQAKKSDAAAVDEAELLTFVIGGETYAIDIDNVVEIVTPRAVTRVPNADESVVGILSLRGTIVTLIDVRRRLSHGAAIETPDTRVVVVRSAGDNLGFVVDRVLRVVKIATSEIGPPPIVHSSESDDSVRGVFRVGDALTILLDLDKVLVRGTYV
jgi:purine-binding chemotaxis protein CheW